MNNKMATVCLYQTKVGEQIWCMYFGGDKEADAEKELYEDIETFEVLRFKVKEKNETKLEIMA